MNFGVNRYTLAELLANATLFLPDQHDTRPALHCVELTYTGDTLQAVSTNGYVLAVFTYRLGFEHKPREPITFVVDHVRELVAVLGACDGDGSCMIESEGGTLCVQLGRVTWEAKLFDADYINWKGLTGEPNQADADVNYYGFQWFDMLHKVRFNGAPIEHIRMERTPKLQPNRFRGKIDTRELTFYIMPVRADW